MGGLSWAAWWRADAARMASWLGTDSVDFRGEIAVGQGWLHRARTLLTGSPPGPELGWLCVHEAEKLLYAGQYERAAELGAEAMRLGQELGLVDLEMLGSSTEGLATGAGSTRAWRA